MVEPTLWDAWERVEERLRDQFLQLDEETQKERYYLWMGATLLVAEVLEMTGDSKKADQIRGAVDGFVMDSRFLANADHADLDLFDKFLEWKDGDGDST